MTFAAQSEAIFAQRMRELCLAHTLPPEVQLTLLVLHRRQFEAWLAEESLRAVLFAELGVEAYIDLCHKAKAISERWNQAGDSIEDRGHNHR